MRRPYVRKLTTWCTTIPVMYLVMIAIGVWIWEEPTLKNTIDAVLSGGALLVAQMIYRESEILREEAKEEPPAA